MIDFSVVTIIISIVIFILAVIFHEVAHGWVAYRLGDPTAKLSGRLTLNPISHIDPFGSVIMPLMLVLMKSRVVFGWAKPVPINFLNLRNPKRDIIWVGLAGPLANLALAFIFVALLRIFPFIFYNALLLEIVYSAIMVNLVLAAFNLIPIPPLDGSRVLFGLLPDELALKYISIERYGFIILFLLLWFGFLDWFINPMLNILAKIIGI